MEPRTLLSTSTLLSACARPACAEVPWHQLYQSLTPRIRGSVLASLARCGEHALPENVDDLVQEVWCRLLDRDRRACREFRGASDGAAGAYLRRVAQGVVVDSLRAGGARKRRPRALLSLSDLAEIDWLPSDPRHCPERRLLARERLARLLELCRRAVGRRSTRQRRRIARLGLIEGWSSGEIAAELGGGWSQRRIDSFLFRVRRRLEKQGLRFPRRPGGKPARPRAD